nr:hypothetical protein 3 [Beihai tombus-like virus 7]
MREARRLSQRLGKTDVFSNAEFLAKYSGPKRTRYENALDSLIARPLDPRKDSIVNAFVKAEKLNPLAKVNPDPRAIQARNARFNIEIGKFLKPIEHMYIGIKSPRGHPIIGKGLNNVQRAFHLEAKMADFTHPVVYSIDLSRFDQHVSRELLEIEHSVYLSCNSNDYFRNLLKEQLNNLCFTRNGWGYKVRGCRMSGDMNTGLGNCLLMYLMTTSAMRYLGLAKYELFVDGDDTLIIIEEHDEWKLSGLTQEFLRYGHEMKLENRATSISEVTWCQAKVVYVDGVPKFVANPTKVLSTAVAGVRHWHDKGRQNMGYSLGQCLLSLYAGVPILQAFCESLTSRGRWNDEVMWRDWIYRLTIEQAKNAKVREVSIETRLAFQRTWKISPEEQMAVERQLLDWDITADPVWCQSQVRQGWFIDPDIRAGPWARGGYDNPLTTF